MSGGVLTKDGARRQQQEEAGGGTPALKCGRSHALRLSRLRTFTFAAEAPVSTGASAVITLQSWFDLERTEGANYLFMLPWSWLI